VLQTPLGSKVRCDVCERRCVLPEGGLGWCRTRQNQGGQVVTLAYGAVSSLAADPIEKKPLYHFYPGTQVLTAGGWSCNFACPWCQNWAIAAVGLPASVEVLAPAEMVRLALRSGCQGVAISYNEPALALEWSLDVFALARARDLYTVFVTNGYLTPEALKLLAEGGLQALNVDIKGDAAALRRFARGVDAEKVWAACRQARALGLHLEVTTLVIPTVNADEAGLQALAERLVADLGPDVPWHVSAYHPAHRFTARPTTPAEVKRAWELGRAAGLNYVYPGNLGDGLPPHTWCPRCATPLIRRRGLAVVDNRLVQGACPQCGLAVPGVWKGAHSHA
jgi:pyruvate formate lyase activating enzyme